MVSLDIHSCRVYSESQERRLSRRRWLTPHPQQGDTSATNSEGQLKRHSALHRVARAPPLPASDDVSDLPTSPRFSVDAWMDGWFPRPAHYSEERQAPLDTDSSS
ncbi:hypothetical protein MTO96_017223 [Rhipicephalus appendiculatus]